MKWETVVASEYCESVRDGTHDTPKQTETGKRLVTSKHIKNGYIFPEEGYFISENDYIKINKRSKVEKWDVLMTMIGNGLGTSAVVKDEPDYAIKNIALFKCKDETKAKWLHYYLSSSIGQGMIFNSLQGSGQPFISLSLIRDFLIPVPSEPNMIRSVSFLSSYDDLIENNQKQIRLLEEAAMRLYKEWFVYLRFPGHENTLMVDGVPEGWFKSKLSELIEIRYGKDHKKIPDGNTPVYGSGGLMRKCNQKLYEGESILIPRKGSLNNIIYVNEAFWTVDTMFYTEIKKEYYAKYVYYALCAYDMYGMNIGAAVPSMTTSILNSFDIVIPTVEVMKTFDEILEPIFNRKKVLLKQIDSAAQARDKLLPKLMSGEIEV